MIYGNSYKTPDWCKWLITLMQTITAFQSIFYIILLNFFLIIVETSLNLSLFYGLLFINFNGQKGILFPIVFEFLKI